MVLVGNKSRLNVCPLTMVSCIGLGPKSFTPAKQTVKNYDNSKREVIEIVSMNVTICSTQFLVEFQVLDIVSSFNLLLRRP